MGNPGTTYARHRHNVGAMVVQEWARQHGQRWRAHRARCQLARIEVSAPALGGNPGAGSASRSLPVILVQPTTFMNEAGGPVVAILRYFRVGAENLLIVHDDMELDFGVNRLKTGGGEGGHNGLRSISKSVKTRDYARFRVGIGRPPGRMDPANFVLREFSGPERRELRVIMSEIVAELEAFIVRNAEGSVPPTFV